MELQGEAGSSWQPEEPGVRSPTAAAPLPPPPPTQAAPPPTAPAAGENGEAALPPPPPPPPQLRVDQAPGMPQAVETSTTAISLQWSPVSCTVLSAVPVAVEYILNYQLQMQQVDHKSGLHPDRWSVQYTGTASFVQVKGLRPGRCYAVRVVADPHVTNIMEVVVTAAPPSDTVLVHTLPCAPMGQPEPQLASRMKKELKFKWSEPEETGGRPLDYTLEMAPAPDGWQGPPPSPEGFTPVYQGPERSYMAKRLIPGVQYCARVKAASCEGESAWSPLGVFYTQATVPSWAPSDAPFVWDTTATSVTLGWPEPAANGGTVTEYEVEMDDGAGFRHVARSQERQCTVTSLRSGILYKFRVRADNEAGRSLWSPLGEGRTAAVPPAACSPPTVLGSSHTSLSIRWQPPEDDGGSAVTSYLVEVRPRSKAAVRGLPDDWLPAYQGPRPACTISTLHPGCSYMVRVCAISAAGTGAHSTPAMLQTAPGTPECPGAPAVIARQQTELSLTWAAPEHDGGTPITAYRLEMCFVGGTDGPSSDGGKGKGKVNPSFELAYLGPARTAVIPDLDPGHRYSFRAAAINEQGSSGWGAVTQAETLPGLPYPVDTLHLAAATASCLKVSWSQPYGRGSRVGSYVLEMAPSTALEAAQQAQQAQQAKAAAAARHAAATAAAEHAQWQQQQQQQQPGAAQQQQEQQQQEQEQQPVANGVSADHGSTPDLDSLYRPVYQGHDTHATVGGLEPHTFYTFRVRAHNATGASVSEAESFATAPAAPSAPQELQLQGSSPTSLAAAWQLPCSDHGATVTGYQLEWARGARTGAQPINAWRPAYQGAALHAQVEGLEAGSRYQLRVRAGNSCGWGPWCPPLACSTAPDVPAAPPGLTVKAVGTTVRAVWEAAEDNGAAVTAYDLEMSGGGGKGGFTTVHWGEGLAQRVQQLAPHSAYTFRVRARNSVGAGPYSQEVCVQTTRAPPSPPTSVAARLPAAEEAAAGGADNGSSAFACTTTSSSSIEVSWAAGQQRAEQAACLSFEVEVEGAGQKLRHTCPGQAQGSTVTGLQPGGTYRVRVRSVGAEGAGHSEWSDKEKAGRASITLPGPTPQQRALAAAAAAAETGGGSGGEGSGGGKPHKRRGGGGGGQQAQRTASVTKTATAKGPPKKGFAALDAKFRRRTSAWLGLREFLALALTVLLLFFVQPTLFLSAMCVFLFAIVCLAVRTLLFPAA